MLKANSAQIDSRSWMDHLLILGVFVAGVGIGLSLVNERKGVEAKPCTCECHCASPLVPKEPESSVLLPFLVGVLLILTSLLAFLGLCVWGNFSKDNPPTFTAKGKGKKGVFGSGVALQIQDGPHGGR